MIGFEISINGREPIVAASDYFVFADLAFGCSSGRIKIKGSDVCIISFGSQRS